MQLIDRVAVVTGGGSGIGEGICLTFAREGAAVVVADRDAVTASQTVAKVEKAGGRAIAIAGDVGNADDAAAFSEAAFEHFGQLDGLVNSAGISPRADFLDLDTALFEQVMRVNVTGTLLCAQAAARRMVPRGRGRIVNIASISGQRASFGRTAYGTSKGAVIQLTRQMALELGPRGITANAIAPGPVDTAMSRSNHTARTRAAYTAAIPTGRYGLVEEIAAAAVYLFSEGAAYVNGHILNLDGGYIAAGIDA